MENKIKQRIQELSLDQKAKLYYMMLLKKGVIDTLPEDPKAAYVQSMMDEPASSKFSEPMGDDPRMDPAIRSDFDDPTFENLKEAASKLGYLKEAPVGKAGAGNPAFKINPSKVPGTAAFDKRAGLTVGGDEKVDEQDLDKIEKGVTAITGGGRQSASVSDRGDSIRVSFRYVRGEFDPEEWDKILKYLTGMGFEIKDESNSYEPNYDREEPPEWVPTIHLKK